MWYVKRTYLIDSENIPLPCLIVLAHARAISDMTAVSYSGFAAMSQFHTSTPAMMVEGKKASNGRVTK